MRRAWIIVVIVVGAALGVAIAGIPSRHQDPPLSVSAAPTTLIPASTTTTTTLAAHPNRADVGVVVVNAGGTYALGGQLTAKVRGAGYTTFSPQTDSSDRAATSIVSYKPGYDADAADVASVVGIGTVQALSDRPVSSKWMGAADVMVVIGTDLH